MSPHLRDLLPLLLARDGQVAHETPLQSIETVSAVLLDLRGAPKESASCSLSLADAAGLTEPGAQASQPASPMQPHRVPDVVDEHAGVDTERIAACWLVARLLALRCCGGVNIRWSLPACCMIVCRHARSRIHTDCNRLHQTRLSQPDEQSLRLADPQSLEVSKFSTQESCATASHAESSLDPRRTDPCMCETPPSSNCNNCRKNSRAAFEFPSKTWHVAGGT